MSGRTSTMLAPVVPNREATTAPSSRIAQLVRGVPLNDPLIHTPAAMTYKLPINATNEIKSSILHRTEERRHRRADTKTTSIRDDNGCTECFPKRLMSSGNHENKTEHRPKHGDPGEALLIEVRREDGQKGDTEQDADLPMRNGEMRDDVIGASSSQTKRGRTKGIAIQASWRRNSKTENNKNHNTHKGSKHSSKHTTSSAIGKDVTTQKRQINSRK